jgi:hypothetical protein
MRRPFVVVNGLFICLLLGASCAAQTTPIVDDSKPTAPTSDCLQRSIPLTVVDNPSNAELQASLLQVQSNGPKISTVSLSRSSITPRVVLLLDTSGSMGQEHHTGWGTGLLAAAFALDILPQESLVALVTFDKEAHPSGFTDRETIRKQLIILGHENTHGRTALYAAIDRASQLFGVPEFGDTIFVISDGDDNEDGISTNRVADEVLRLGIRVFAFIVRDRDSPTLSENQNPKDFADFVADVGGIWRWVRITPKWLAGSQAPVIFNATREQLQSPYRLDLQMAAPLFKPAKLKIKSELKQIELSYPRRIEPCSALAAAIHP